MQLRLVPNPKTRKYFLIDSVLQSKIVCLLAGLFSIVSGFGQSPLFKHFTVEDGLPSSEVYMARQDSRGYMWFATDRGACRFDGYSFKTFTSEDGLADNTIFGIYKDYKNRIWFISFSGQLSYYYNDRIYTHSANEKLKELVSSEIITSMYVDEGDTIWLGFSNGSKGLMINPDQEVKTVDDNWIGESKYFIKKFKDQSITFGLNPSPVKPTGDNLTIKEPNSRTEVSLGVNEVTKSTHHPYAKTLRNGGYFLSINNHLFHILGDELIGKYSTKSKLTKSLFEDSKGNLWAGQHRYGAICFSNGLSDTSQISHYLPEQSVSDVFEDNQGGLWFTTLTNGVFFLPSREYLSFNRELGLEDESISSIAGNASGIWAGSLKGKLYQIQPDGLTGYKVSTYSLRHQLQHMHSLEDGSIWIHSDSNLHTITPKGKIETLPPISVLSLDESYDGTKWIGSHKYLHKLKGQKVIYSSKDDQFKKRVFSVLEEAPGKVWLGCIDGLWFYNGEKYERVGQPGSVLSNRINSIEKDRNGNLWLATMGGGVVVKNGNRFQTISRQDGLAGNLCNFLHIDSLNNIWVATNQGLSKIEGFNFAEDNIRISNYTTIEGLISNEIKQVFVAGRKVWVATSRGITVFDQQKVKLNTIPPPIYIQHIRIREKDTLIREHYDLAYNKNFIGIDFVGLSYNNAGQLLYKYKMDGLGEEDQEWTITKDRSLQYTTLPPGNYQFTVYAMNNSGKWSDFPATFSFTISPPFYRTWWFILMCIGSVTSVIWFVFYFRYRTLKLQTNLLRRTLISEQKALRSQMTPHFIFNSLNSIQQLISENDRLQAIQSTSKFAKLMRKILNNSAQSAITLSEEIETLQLYLDLESLRFEGKFQYIIKIGMDIDTEDTEIPPMLIQPYLENALWHGIMNRSDRSGKVELKIDRKDQLLVCSITDNGIGRKKAAALRSKHASIHKSSGMQITEERLKILNATRNSSLSVKIVDLEDKDGEALGTRVEIYVPLDY